MQHNPVGWFEIYVEDMERAKAFYELVFDIKLVRLNNPDIELWGFPMELNKWGAGGALVKMPGKVPGGNSVIIYFSCADCTIEAARASKVGGEILKPKMSIGEYGYIALIRDSEGTIVGLHSLQ